MTLAASQECSRPLAPTTGRVALAEPDPIVRGWLRPVLEHDVGLEVIEAPTAAELERVTLQRGGPDLVVTNSRLGPDSALQTLARVRATGCTTPFLVYTSFRDSLMRVLVSDVEGTVLSSRIVDLDNFGELAEALSRRAAESAPRPSTMASATAS